MVVIGILFNSLLFLGIAWYYRTYPPKEINWFYGYRTRRSQQNQIVWDAANKHSSESFWRLSIAVAIVGLVCIVFRAPIGLLIQIAVLIIGLLLSVISTERYLDRYFDKNGNPKD